MKICVLRRDGKPIHNGMCLTTQTLAEQFFGEKAISVERNEIEFTQTLTFEIEDNENMNNEVLSFIIEISHVNPLYAVRVNE